MTISTGNGQPFVFEIPPPQSRRVVALAFVAVLLLQATYFFHRIGFNRAFYAIRNHLGIWIIVIGLAAVITYFLRLAFPPRSSWPRLSIQKDRISYIPGRIDRFCGEPIHEASIPPQSDVVVFCRKLLEGLNGGYVPDGYVVIIRAAGKTEHEIKADILTRLDSQQCQEIADGITAVTGLPVQFVLRRQSMTVGIEETQWIPTVRKTNLKLAVALTLGVLPFVGGMIVGYFVTRPAFIVEIGFALWFAQMLALSIYSKRKWALHTAMYSLTTLFTFGAAYSFAVVLVALMFRAH